MGKAVQERTGRGRLSLLAVLAAALALGVTACGGDDESAAGGAAGAEETVTLSAISFLPPDHPVAEAAIPDWIELVEQESGGSIQIDYRGGPEAIPTEDQFSAVVDGLADVGFNVPTFYLNEVPAGNTMHLSPYTSAEERENGYFDFLDRIHRDAGAAYLGRWITVQPFFIWTNDRIQSLDDLAGKRMRSVGSYQHIFDALGVKSVNIVIPEVFTALERGLVDGFAINLNAPRGSGWLEVTKFLVNEPFYNQNAGIIMNPSKLDSLSDGQKEALTRATQKFEEQLVEKYLELDKQEWEQITELLTIIELPEEESQRFTDLWYEQTWKALVDLWKVDQATLDEAKQLLNYDEISGNPEAIGQIPCAGAGERAKDQPFC